MNLMDAMLGHRALTDMGFSPEVIREAFQQLLDLTMDVLWFFAGVGAAIVVSGVVAGD